MPETSEHWLSEPIPGIRIVRMRYKMKIVCIVVFPLLFSSLLQAQDASATMAFGLTAGIYRQPDKREIPSSRISGTPLEQGTPRDTVKYDMYGNLLNDNPEYNPKKPLWRPLIGIIGSNVTTNLMDTYILKLDFTHVGFTSWGRTLKAGAPWGPGWEWDQDRFGNNFLLHPYGGSAFFNSARVNGYTFWESIPYVFLGSYMWKIFGETGVPEREDLINTTATGVFLGEILYRLSSDILDDQTAGADRFFRELAAAILAPTRFFNRFLGGELSRSVPTEVYQKEPVNITLSSGYHRVNNGISLQEGSNSVFFDLHLDYGNPFEQRSRKPFDYFKLRTDLDFGVGRKIFDNVTGYGILFGRNFQAGQSDNLIGLFQHMDYFDNKSFEIGALAFGPGIISKLPISKSVVLYTNFHVDIAPFGGLSRPYGPDTTQVRDYDFVGGMEGKLESTLNLGGWTGITFIGYYWWFHTYVGDPGDSYIALIKPRIAFTIFNNVSIGFEHMVYYSDRYLNAFPSVHSVRTEQKIFLQVFLEEFKFSR
jgi:hypothetical protein